MTNRKAKTVSPVLFSIHLLIQLILFVLYMYRNLYKYATGDTPTQDTHR